MKRILFFIGVLLFFQGINAQSVNLSKLGAVPRNYYEEIPFEFVSEKIIIPVEIQGETYRFILDTGAPNLISNRLFKKLGGKAARTLNVSDANGQSSRMNVAVIQEFKLGQAAFRDIPALVNLDDENIVFRCFEVDGLIGSNMLSTSVVQFNLPKKTVIVTDQRKRLSLDKAVKSKLELVGKQKSPYVWIELMGENTGRERLLLDTGAADLYDLGKNHYRIFRQEPIFQEHGRSKGTSSIGLFGAGQESEHFRLFLPTLKFGGLPFREVVLETSDDDNSRLGATILNFGILTLDYKKKRFYYEAFSDEVFMDSRVRGVSLSSDGRLLTIGHVWDKDLEDKLNFGDLILEINGQAYDVCDIIRDRLRFREVEVMRVKVQPADGGEPFEIDLPNRTLAEPKP